MGLTRAGAFLRPRAVRTIAVLWFAIAAAWPAAARAADMTLSSKTYLLYSRSDVTGGPRQDFAPLYEYLAGDARNLGGEPLSFHFYGWGRQDLADDTGSGPRSGDIGSAFLLYAHPRGNAEARLGRFFLAEGTAAEILDGAFVKVRTPLGLGVSLFGGIPVEQSITGTETGDSLFGGRLFFSAPGFAEVGATWLREKGNFAGDDRDVVGGDLWVRAGIPVELFGRAAYNLATKALASQRYVLRVTSIPRVDLSAGYESYRYKDLFQTALNPAYLAPSIDNSDKVRTLFAAVGFAATKELTVEGAVKSIRHDVADPGDARRGEIGVRYAYNDRKDTAGLSAAVLTADRDENEYTEYRVFASYSPAAWRFALDGLTHRYKTDLLGTGIKNEYQVVASAGWQVLPNVKVTGDLAYTRSPRLKEDYGGLVKASLDLAAATGGKK